LGSPSELWLLQVLAGTIAITASKTRPRGCEEAPVDRIYVSWGGMNTAISSEVGG
jgi:hypothetical protein